ncbi:MAG: tripartite tricarboxylate transporter substrate binding protein [Pseudomonadota bacterium]
MGSIARILSACALTLVGAAAQVFPADAQSYPSKPITVIVPFGPGSATDTICRIVTQELAANLNASIIIENKVGANGAIAGAYVARSASDGYTLLMATNSPLSAAPSLNKSISYDPVKDFVGLSRIGSYTFTLAINKDVPAQNLQELIAYAKANPGKLSHASGNSSGVVAGETFKAAAGLDILHVPYRSAPPAMNDLIAGRVSMMFTDLTIGLPHVRSGALRALATTRLQRSTLLPDLPTLDEAGVKGFDMDSWAGLFAPAGTSPEIVAKLNTELRKIIDNPETKAKIAVLGFEAFSSSTEELNEHVRVQLVKWTKMIKDAGIEPE